jgi:hypothetical protein
MKNYLEKENIQLYLFIIFSVIYVFFTNSNQEILSLNKHSGASSKLYYLSISENFPNVATIINYHHAQRFIIPYLIGLFAKISNIDILFIFKAIMYLEFLLIFIIKLRLVKLLEIDFYSSLIFFSIFIFNPYLLRYFIIYPEMIVDLTFILSGYLFIYSIATKQINLFFIAFILALISRQTGIAFFISLVVSSFIYKKDLFINKKNTIMISLILVVVYFFIFIYLKRAGLEEMPSDAVFGLVKYIINEINFFDLITFILLPLIILLPFFLLALNRKFRILEVFKNPKAFFLILALTIIIAQPVLGGPSWTGKNIIRLVLLGYPIIFYLILCLSELKYIYSKTSLFFIFTFFIIWSFHPSYSTIGFFKFFYIEPLIK